MNKLVENAYMDMFLVEKQQDNFKKEVNKLLPFVNTEGKQLLKEIIKLYKNDSDNMEQLDIIAKKMEMIIKNLIEPSQEKEDEIHNLISFL